MEGKKLSHITEEIRYIFFRVQTLREANKKTTLKLFPFVKMWKNMEGYQPALQNKGIPYFFDYKTEFFSFQNNPKDLDLSCKTDLDLWDCLGRVNLVL